MAPEDRQQNAASPEASKFNQNNEFWREVRLDRTRDTSLYSEGSQLPANRVLLMGFPVMRGPRKGIAALLLVCSAAASPAAVGHVSAQALERSLLVSALDAKGQPVARLDPADVIVREDGVRREVLRIVPAADPMQVALLVDNTAAAEPHIANLRDGLKAFVRGLGSGHALSLVTFADRPTLVVSFAAQSEPVLEAIDRLFAQPSSGAYLLDAVVDAAQGFIRREAARPVMVVVMTEGIEFSTTPYDIALDRLAASGAQLHVLLLTGNAASDTITEVRNRNLFIDRGTRDTGGRRENLLTNMGLDRVLGNLADELTHQYKVTYARPQTLVPPSRVEVAPARDGLTVRGVPVKAAASP